MERGAVSAPLLTLGATAATVAALVADVRADEHPTHLVVLAQVAVVMLWLGRRLRLRVSSAAAVAAAAVAAQPLLHLGTSPGRHTDVPHDHDAAHLALSELPSAVLQVAVPVLVLVALIPAAHLARLLVHVVRPPSVGLPGPVETRLRRPITVHPSHRGPLLRWCGWALVAGRRGPPAGCARAVS